MDNNNEKILSDVAQIEEEEDENLGLFDKMDELMDSPSFQKSFSELATASERIKFVMSQKAMNYATDEIVLADLSRDDDHKKCGTKAAQFGKVGNDAFQARRYEDALESYSSAIRYAPQDGSLLPIAFGSRSGAFFLLKQYEAALKDIVAAETHPQYKPFFMLTIRKCQCLVRLGRGAQVKKILDSIKRDDLNKSDATMLDKFCQRERENLKVVDEEEGEAGSMKEDIQPELLKNVSSVIKILYENGRFVPKSSNSSLSSKVEVRFDEMNGRHLVTTQNVRFGDILAVTKPYAAILSNEQELHFCHHCLTSLKPIPNIFPRTVPCTDCTRVLYCSEHCRAESWQEYHRFECPRSGDCFEKSFPDKCVLLQLALRTWFVAGGLESIRAVTQKLDSSSSGDGCDGSSKSADFTCKDSYENVHRMAMADFDNTESYIKMAIIAAMMFKWLKFTEIDDVDGGASPNVAAVSENDDIFTIETLLRHYRQILSDKMLFVRSDQSALDDPMASDEDICTLDPLIGLVRKSCNPNISIQVVDCARPAPHVTNVCVFFALKPMPAGTVLQAIGPDYGDTVKCRLYLKDFVQSHQTYLNKSKPKLLCPCEYCRAERRERPFGPVTVADTHELVGCGANCGGFIRRTEGDEHFKCCTCKREIVPNELAYMKKVYSDISKFNSQAIGLIGRMKTLIVNIKRKKRNGTHSANIHREKLLSTVLFQLETLINDHIAPRARVHSRLMLAELYEQLIFFYRFLMEHEPKMKLDHLVMAWKYADTGHAILEGHFGGDSLELLMLLEENVRYFSKEIGEVRLGLMEPVGQKSAVDGRVLEFRLNLNDDTEDESRKARICLVQSFQAAQKRLDNMNERYKMI